MLTALLEGVSCSTVCEELNPSAGPAYVNVEVEEPFPQFCPFADEKFPRSPRTSSSKGNVTQIFHCYVAGWTIHNNTGLRG